MKTPRSLPANFHAQEYGGIEPPHELLFAPARTVLPLLRSPLGYRMVHPMRALPVTLFLICVPPFTWALYGELIASSGRHLPDNIGQLYLVAFALLSFAASCAVFARRVAGQRKAEPVHTLECGHSWLAYYTDLPLWICEMLIVPLAVGSLGWLIDDTFSMDLGRWLMLCGCSLFGLALWEHRRIWSQHRSAIDENQRAKAYEARFSRQEQAQANAGPVVAELAEGLRRTAPKPVTNDAPSHQQRGNVSAGRGRGHTGAQDTDDPVF